MEIDSVFWFVLWFVQKKEKDKETISDPMMLTSKGQIIDGFDKESVQIFAIANSAFFHFNWYLEWRIRF